MNNIPSGYVTFLFSDIDGSTRLAQEFPKTLQFALERHHKVMQNAIESNNGFVFEIIGDALCCAFENAHDAVKAAVDAQLKLCEEKWNDAVINVRMGIHSGKAEWNGNKYMGYITLARTARVMSAAYGSQILVSNHTFEIARETIPGKISFLDLGKKRLKDLIHPIKLYQIVSPGLKPDFPPLKTLDASPNNLPIQLTAFIGREKEIEDIRKLLSEVRLLTLVGPGGTGKTRLSLQIGAELINNFENGVWITELATLQDHNLLSRTIANTFGLNEEPGKSAENILIDHLKDKELMLILDNCEHLINSCARISEILLQKSSKLKIIATSREALKCNGEHIHLVLQLEFPDPKDNPSPEKLTQYEAVRLFIERALLVNQNFSVTNENAPALSQICFHLDGIPLAIELAAARVKVLTVEKINDRLSDRFKLLTGGKRTALPRQQTLRALIDWSYDLLSEEEKILWRILSVFTGGFTYEAAENVCGDLLNEEDTLDLLNNLVEKSIIIHDETQERFRILESTRQYGFEKLEEEGKLLEVLTKHLLYYRELSESAEGKLTGPEQKKWLDILESENTNLQIALDWSLKGNLYEDGLRFAGALGRYWLVRGHFSEGSRWYDELLEAGKDVSKPVRAKAYLNAARMARLVRDFKKLDSMNERCLELYRELGDKRGIAYGLNSIGVTEFSNHNFEKARSLFQESLDLAREINDEYSIAFFLGNLAEVVLALNDFEYANNLFDESITIYRRQGNKRGIAYTLMGLGALAFKKEEYDKASSLFEESISLNREIKDKQRVTEVLPFLIETEIKRAQYSRARILCEDCLSLMKELKNNSGISEVILRLAEIEYSEGQYERAAQLIGLIEDSIQSSISEQFVLEPGKYERLYTQLKEKLREGSFCLEFSKGKQMTLEQFTVSS